MKKILAAIDFSNASEGVTAAAAELAKSFGAELHLIHVVEPEPTYTAYGFTPDEFPAMHAFHDKARSRAQQALDKAASKLVGLTAITHLEDGSPLKALERMIKEINADFVVLGSHGHGVVASLILGSVAEGMVRRSLVPTLVIPATDQE